MTAKPYTHMELNSPGARPPLEWARVNATVEALEQAQKDAAEEADKWMRADRELEHLGFRRCDVAACNCGGYHQHRPTVVEESLRAQVEALRKAQEADKRVQAEGTCVGLLRDVNAALVDRDKWKAQADRLLAAAEANIDLATEVAAERDAALARAEKAEADLVQSKMMHREAFARAEKAEADIAKARELLWLKHGHTGLYGDDGEMQCATCRPMADFRRDPFLDMVKQAMKTRTGWLSPADVAKVWGLLSEHATAHLDHPGFTLVPTKFYLQAVALLDKAQKGGAP